MPAWWGRKSNKSKEEHHHHSLFSELNSKKSSIHSDNSPTKYSYKRCSKSLEELGHHGILSPNLRGISSGNSGFDSDGERKVVGHPLPRPSSSNYSGGFVVSDHGHGGSNGVLASGSASVSSVSSSGSNSDDPPIVLDHIQSGVFRFVSSF